MIYYPYFNVPVYNVDFRLPRCTYSTEHFSAQLGRRAVLCISEVKVRVFEVKGFYASMLNMQQAWNLSAGFARLNCSGSGGQGNVDELKLSRRNGNLPLRLAVRDSFWRFVKKSAFSAAHKLYHAVGELHARKHENGFPLWLVQTPNIDFSFAGFCVLCIFYVDEISDFFVSMFFI